MRGRNEDLARGGKAREGKSSYATRATRGSDCLLAGCRCAARDFPQYQYQTIRLFTHANGSSGGDGILLPFSTLIFHSLCRLPTNYRTEKSNFTKKSGVPHGEKGSRLTKRFSMTCTDLVAPPRPSMMLHRMHAHVPSPQPPPVRNTRRVGNTSFPIRVCIDLSRPPKSYRCTVSLARHDSYKWNSWGNRPVQHPD